MNYKKAKKKRKAKLNSRMNEWMTPTQLDKKYDGRIKANIRNASQA